MWDWTVTWISWEWGKGKHVYESNLKTTSQKLRFGGFVRNKIIQSLQRTTHEAIHSELTPWPIWAKGDCACRWASKSRQQPLTEASRGVDHMSASTGHADQFGAEVLLLNSWFWLRNRNENVWRLLRQRKEISPAQWFLNRGKLITGVNFIFLGGKFTE